MLRRAPLRQTASEPHASRSSPMAAEWLVALTSRGLGHWTTQQHRRITHTHTNFSFSLSLSVFTIAACIATDRGRFFFFWGGGFGTIGSEHYPPSYDIFFCRQQLVSNTTRTFNFRFGSKIRKGGRGLHHWRNFLLSLELREAGFFFRRGAALMGMAFHHSAREEQDFITALGKVFR